MRRRVLSGRLMNLIIPGVFALTPAFAANWFVSAGQSLQQVLNQALPGDTITLQAGATFTGNFVLPNKAGTAWITIQNSLMPALPPAGQRVNPSHAPYMAKLMTPNGAAVLSAAQGAHNYRIIGLELTAASGIYTQNLVQLGVGNETSSAQLPYAIEFDRVYIHGDKTAGGKRGIGLNSRSTNITNSYFSDFKSTGQETQAIGGWNGPGPFQIINNFIEAAGVNIMFGGARSGIANLVPSDIVIKKNHFFKPLTWRVGSPTYAGTSYMIKNLLEFKNARRVTVDGNVFENNWAQAQAGFAVLFTVRTENGTMPWAVVEDVVFSNNILTNIESGINMLGKDGSYGGATRRVTIRNNVFEKVNARWIQLLHACHNTTIDHNTAFHGTLLLSLDGAPSQGLVYKNNISARGTYGIFGNGKGEGNSALEYYAPGAVVTKNGIAGASAGMYPAGNYFPGSIYDARFVDAFGGNYTLASDSPYRLLGTDGRNLGADIVAVAAATSGVVVVR